LTLNPWDVFKDLSNTKVRLITEDNKEEYPSYLINGAFSRFIDTVFYANEMNMNHHLDNLAQYDFYYHSLRRKKRYSGKWGKVIATPQQEAIALYHDYSLVKAKEAEAVLEACELYNAGVLDIINEYAESIKEINTP